MNHKVHLLVDGNAFYHCVKTAGVDQDFAALERGVAALLQVEGVASKHFYTRPPVVDDGKRVVGWLKAHGWNTHLYAYDHTHQDSMYVTMVSDMHTLGSLLDRWVIVSGSGTLVYPLKAFPGEVTLVTTQASANKHLVELSKQSLGRIQITELVPVLKAGGK